MPRSQFNIGCKGRNLNRREVLETPVKAVVVVHQSLGTNSICIDVQCVHSCGSHGGGCKAGGGEASCPYSIDLPFALDNPA